MKTKEEVIKEAWGDYWDTFKDSINDHGWCKGYPALDDTYDNWLQDHIEMEYVSIYSHGIEEIVRCRPKSLKGIENNNGWIKIEDGLPKTDGWYHCISNHEEKMYIFNGITFVNALGIKREVTHYQPINKPLKPLY